MYLAGTTGEEVFSPLPTFEEWAKGNEYMKGIFGF